MDNKPSKFFAYIAMASGALLCLVGLTNFTGIFGALWSGGLTEILQYQLGSAAVSYLGIIIGPLALVHGYNSLAGNRSNILKFPPFYFGWIVFAVVLGLGSSLLNFNILTGFLFPIVFVLGAALPSLVVLAWVYRKLAWPLTWRQTALAFIAGSTISVALAIFLETVLPYLAFLLIAPLQEFAYGFASLGWGTSGMIERLFASPFIIVFMIATALEAPIPEEFAKVLGLPMFGRGRIKTEQQAFAIGLACGAGFAVLENMLYEGLYAQANGWTWGGVTLLRGFGAVLHPLCSGLVALGWYRMKEQGTIKLFKAYLASVGLHTLWNGGFQPLLYLTGLEAFGESNISIYGESLGLLLVIYLVLLSAGLWVLLRRMVNSLSVGVEIDLTVGLQTRRAMAAWALVSVLVIVILGAALNLH